MQIVIGSLNPVKRQAAESVLAPLYPDADFRTVAAPSGVPDQPWGDAQTRQGAINRARAALANSGAALAVGFEGGLIETEIGVMTCAWCAVAAADGRIGVGGGAHMLIPAVAAARLTDEAELGPIMDALTGQQDTKHHAGAIGILTGGLEDRASAYAHILRLALAPFRQPDYFQEAATP